MNRQQLTQIAGAMRAELPATGHIERTMGHVYLMLFRRNGSVQLVIGHRDHMPRGEDSEVIARAFGVAIDSEPKPIETKFLAQDGRYIRIYGHLFSWVEDCLVA